MYLFIIIIAYLYYLFHYAADSDILEMCRLRIAITIHIEMPEVNE